MKTSPTETTLTIDLVEQVLVKTTKSGKKTYKEECKSYPLFCHFDTEFRKVTVLVGNYNGNEVKFNLEKLEKFQWRESADAELKRKEMFRCSFEPNFFDHSSENIKKVHGELSYYEVRMILLAVNGKSIPDYVLNYISSDAYDRGHSSGYEEVLNILEGSLKELQSFKES